MELFTRLNDFSAIMGHIQMSSRQWGIKIRKMIKYFNLDLAYMIEHVLHVEIPLFDIKIKPNK